MVWSLWCGGARAGRSRAEEDDTWYIFKQVFPLFPSPSSPLLSLQVSLPEVEVPVSAGWPTAGCCEFVNVAVRYRHGLPLTLKGVSFRVHGGHRVGECRVCVVF